MANEGKGKPTDLTPHQQMLFEGISEAIGILQKRGMHTSDMTPVFDWWAKWSREATVTSDRSR